jgi:hypothetical protein
MRMLFRISVLILICTTHVPTARSEPLVRFRADRILPEGWQITSVATGDSPYGYFKEKDLGGLAIHLTGSATVAEKGKLTTEGLSLWFMPVAYQGAPPPGTPHLPTPHRPATLVCKTSQFSLYALPWNATPTWKNWKADLLKCYSIKPASIKELKVPGVSQVPDVSQVP